MTEVKLEEIKKRSVIGIVALTSRTAFLQIISNVGFFLLTIFLDLKLFGVFVIVQAASSFLNYFSDIGLAGALIQKKESLTEEDLKTTFTVQQLLVFLVAGIAFMATKKIAALYGLDNQGVILFRALIFAFVLSSLKTIPSIILERSLKFQRLVIPQLIETVTFYILANILAWKGFGLASLTWAVLGRAVVGLIAIYIICPWVPKLGFQKKNLRELLSFGLPLQINSFLGLMKDDLFTLYLGIILPFESLSLIGWAKKWSDAPLRLIMDNIIKVTFPTYARLQNYPEKLTKGINKTIFFLALIVLPMATGIIFIMEPFLSVIPKYQKWNPALLSFYFFVGGAIFASLSTPLTNALNAIGKIKTTLKLMIFWTVLTWTLIPVSVSLMGFNGVALAHFLMGASVILVVMITKKYINFSVWNNIKPSLISSLLLAVFLYSVRGFLQKDFISLIFYIFAGVVVYAGAILLLFRLQIMKEIRSVLVIIKS